MGLEVTLQREDADPLAATGAPRPVSPGGAVGAGLLRRRWSDLFGGPCPGLLRYRSSGLLRYRSSGLLSYRWSGLFGGRRPAAGRHLPAAGGQQLLL